MGVWRVPEGHGLEEDVEWVWSGDVSTDDQRKKDLYGDHGDAQHGQFLPRHAFFYQLQPRHSISRSKANLQQTVKAV